MSTTPKTMFATPLLAIFALAFSACTRHVPTPEAVARAGGKAFHFAADQVTRLAIEKSDPDTGDHWAAVLEKGRNADGDPAWFLDSGPDGRKLADRFANTSLIDHLLDTLTTLPIDGVAAPGTDTPTLPRFALRWNAPGYEGDFRVGAPVGPASAEERAAYVVDGAPDSHLYLVSGAAIQMLGMLKSFESLRLNRLAAFSEDDVEQIRLKKGREKAYFYAQRDGDHWADARHHKLAPNRVDAQALLDRFSHTRILRFLGDGDTGADVARLKAEIDRAPMLQASLTERSGRDNLIRLRWDGHHLYATLSTRPGAAFELYPETLQYFETRRRSQK